MMSAENQPRKGYAATLKSVTQAILRAPDHPEAEQGTWKIPSQA
jgi:hypothetical protein